MPHVLCVCTDVRLYLFPSAVNLARSCGPARDQPCSTAMSSTIVLPNGLPAEPSLANDGNRAVNSFTHTDEAVDNWWRVDFGIPQIIVGGTIWNRGTCCQERLNGFKLWVGNNLTYNGQGNSNCYTALTKEHVTSPFTHVFSCHGRGRYFFVHLPSQNPLSLAEVEVIDSGNVLLNFGVEATFV
jgi:hypothetical protein